MRLTILAISALASMSLTPSAMAQTGKEQEPAGGTTTTSPSGASGANPDTADPELQKKGTSGAMPNPGEQPHKYENEMNEVKERMQRIRARREGRESGNAQVNEREERGEKSHQTVSPAPGASASPNVSASPSATAVASPSASIGLTPTPSPR